jgi:hypothetical protein
MKKVLTLIALIIFPIFAQAKEGFYIGGEAGTSIITRTPKKNDLKHMFASSSHNVLGALSVHRDLARFVGGIHGGYNFDVNSKFVLAPQIGFRHIQRARFTAADMIIGGNVVSFGKMFEGSHQLNIVDIVLTSTYHINKVWDVQAQLGAAVAADKIKVAFGSSLKNSKTKTTVCPQIGLGVGHRLLENVRLSLNATHIFGKRSKTSIIDFSSPASILASYTTIAESFKKVPSSTSLTLSLQYLF